MAKTTKAKVYSGSLEGFVEIPGFPNYAINKNGDVISFVGGAPKLLKPWLGKNGYLTVTLHAHGIKVKRYIHRLIAEMFIDNPDGSTFVRHLDDDKLNNDISNLAWGTYSDNRRDMAENGHEFRKAVYCYETDTVYYSGVEAAKALGSSKSAIVHACKGISTSTNGYHVCYESDMDEKLKNLDEWLKPNNNFKALKARNLDTGEELEFESRNEAAAYLGIPACGISSTIHGTTKHSHRWFFWEED